MAGVGHGQQVRHLPLPWQRLIGAADLCIPQRPYRFRILGTLGNMVELHRYEGRMVDANFLKMVDVMILE
jgi:hypothetical protein